MELRDFVAKRYASVLAQLDGKSQGKPLAFGKPQSGVPAEVRRQVIETLGAPFLVFRDKVQKDLKLSDEQKKKLEKRLQDTVQETMQFFQSLQDAKPQDRQKEHQAYVKKSQEKLAAFLEGALKEEQLQRLRQVMLQREGLFALGDPALMKELDITDKQRQQFFETVQELQKNVESLLKQARKEARPEEIRPKIMKIRDERMRRIEALLSDAQKNRWKKMLGTPLDLAD
jgi:hypothetical protein